MKVEIGGYLTPQDRAEFYGKSRRPGRLHPKENACPNSVYHIDFELRTGKLQSRIEILRRMMEEMGLEMGISHPAVLRISQTIDDLHNELTRITLGRF